MRARLGAHSHVRTSVEKDNNTINTFQTYSEADFDGYQAAPLLILGKGRRQKLIHRQDALAEGFARTVRSELTPFVKPNVVNFVAKSIITRMHQREGLNGISYTRRLFETPNFDEVEGVSRTAMIEACRRTRLGGATPRQNVISRAAYGMASIEIANHTVLHEFRKDLGTPMWDDISELIDRDASPQPEDMERLTILGFDRDFRTNQHVGAMRIGMKRLIGHIEDGTAVKGRTTAIINTSPSSGFDQSILEEFRDTGGSYADLAELPAFQSAVSWLIRNELSPGLVLARNETVYGHNELIEDIIVEQDSSRYRLAA